MTRLELLAEFLDKEVSERDLQSPMQVFLENLEFWQLCLEAKRLLLDEKVFKLEKAERRLQIKKTKLELVKG